MQAHIKIDIDQATYYNAHHHGNDYWSHLSLLLGAPESAPSKST